MADLPTGTVTLLFTDIAGSTQLVQRLGPRYEEVLAAYRSLLRSIFARHEGQEVDTQGDSFFVAFPRARDAVLAAIEVQHALAVQGWPEGISLATRMGLHTGEPRRAREGYVGLDVHRAARIGAAGHGGQVLLSATTHELVAHELPEGVALRDLGEHRLKDLRYPSRIFQLVIPELQVNFPPLKTLDAYPTNLPLQLTSFIGRAQEIEAVRQRLLDPQVRLLTLIGPGGTGKTRLALQAAAAVLDAFSDGVWVIDLAPITDPTLVLATIAQTLGVQKTQGQALIESLVAYLRQKDLLLILDNFEQVVAGAPSLVELLLGVPQLKALVTSRVVLGVYGEHVVQVTPLALPDLTRLPPIERLTDYDAVRLFVERARAARADFGLTAGNAEAVVAICRHLDGLPLAIELAAARIRVLPPTALLQRLRNRLQVLTGGAATLPARQQTLRATIEWSYYLLDTTDQTLLRRLAVFVGGWTLEAAENVCNRTDMPGLDVLDGLQSLIDKSLVQQVEGVEDVPLFRLLETIREYAWEQLVTHEKAQPLQQQHATYYLALAEAAEPELRGVQQARWLDRLEAEHDNLRSALAWTLEDGTIEIGLRMTGALVPFWYTRGYLSEGRRWLNAVLARARASVNTSSRVLAPNQHVAKALTGAGEFAWLQGDYALARGQLEESVDLWRQLADTRGLADTLHKLGHVVMDQRNYAAAQSLFDESLTRYRAAGDTLGGLPLLSDLGLVAYHQGDYAAARAHFEQGLPHYRAQGLQLHVGVTLNRLGDLARLAGDYERAAGLYKESLAVFETLSSDPYIASARHKLAYVLRQRGDYPQMYALLRESLRLQHQLGNKQGIAECLAGLGSWATAVQQVERATRIFEATDKLLATAGVPLAPADHVEYARDLAIARAQLAEAAFATMWAEGQSMALDQAVAYALSKEAAPGA